MILLELFAIILAILLGVYLAAKLWSRWLKFINAKWLAERDWRLLHIHLPANVHRTPEAMEYVLHSMVQAGGVGTWFDKYWKGGLLMWFSLEIASIDGKIYFFIRTEEKFRDLIESQIYAQYPDAEIREVSDYTRHVTPPGHGGWTIFGTEYNTGDDTMPIRTYVDLKLDRPLLKFSEKQPESRIDPMSPLLEGMGSIGHGEQIWFQILIRTDKFAGWDDRAKEKAEELFKDGRAKDDENNLKFEFAGLSRDEKIKAIERKSSKTRFECGIRLIYLGHGDSFRPGRIGGVLGAMRTFGSPGFSSFKFSALTGFEYPWQSEFNRQERQKKIIFDNYVNRTFFYNTTLADTSDLFYSFLTRILGGKKESKPFVLNTEELATIYHFPGQMVEAPTIMRQPNTATRAPDNIPI